MSTKHKEVDDDLEEEAYLLKRSGKLKEFKKIIEDEDSIHSRSKKKAIEKEVASGDDSIERELDGIAKEAEDKYKEKHPIKAWANYHISDSISPIYKALPKVAQEKLDDMHDYGDEGGITGTLASIILDPINLIPGIGIASKAPKIMKAVEILRKAPGSKAMKAAAAGATYGAVKASGRNNLVEEGGPTDNVLGNAILGGTLGGAGTKAFEYGKKFFGRKKNAEELIEKKLKKSEPQKEATKSATKKDKEVDFVDDLAKDGEEAAKSTAKATPKIQLNDDFDDLSNAEKKALKESLTKKIKDEEKRLKEALHIEKIDEEPALEVTKRVGGLYNKKRDEFKALYDNLSIQHSDKVVPAEIFKKYKKEIAEAKKMSDKKDIFSKDGFNIDELNLIKTVLEKHVPRYVKNSADAKLVERKANFERELDLALKENHPELFKEYKGINAKYKEEMVPLRENREIKGVGKGKLTELSPNFLNQRSSSTEKIMHMMENEDLLAIKRMIVDAGGGNNDKVVARFKRLPKAVAKKVLGDDYDAVMEYTGKVNDYKQMMPEMDELGAIAKFIKRKVGIFFE